MNFKEILFQYYPNNISYTYPIGVINLRIFLDKIAKPSDRFEQLYIDIYNAHVNGNQKLKDELKSQLFSFTPAAFVNRNRSKIEIRNFTGLAPLDWDDIKNPESFRDFLRSKYDFIVAAWLSSSKKGVRALARIPVVNKLEEYKAFYWGMANDELSQYPGFDSSTQNAVLPFYMSYDKDIWINENPTIWDSVGENPKAFDAVHPIVQHDLVIESNSQRRIYGIMKSKIDKIYDNGHPQMNSAFIALGGYVGTGYLTASEAQNIAFQLIDGNQYLVQKSGKYKTTAKDAINYGISKPLMLKAND